MMPSAVQGAPIRKATPRFAGVKPAPDKQSEALEEKVARYRAGWEALQAWDAQKHPVPVLQTVRLNRLEKHAREFLARQAKAHPAESVPFIVGISGSPASGKTTALHQWIKDFPRLARETVGWRKAQHGPLVDTIEQDNYFKDNSERFRQLGRDAFFTQTNLDTPDQVLLDQAREELFLLKNGKAPRIPRYHFPDSSRRDAQSLKVPAPFVVTEGFMAFVPKPLRKLMDLKIFFTVDDETIHRRWWSRAAERNLDNDAGKLMYQRAMDGYKRYTQPTARHADVVINSAATIPEVRETMRQIGRLLLKTFYPTQHG